MSEEVLFIRYKTKAFRISKYYWNLPETFNEQKNILSIRCVTDRPKVFLLQNLNLAPNFRFWNSGSPSKTRRFLFGLLKEILSLSFSFSVQMIFGFFAAGGFATVKRERRGRFRDCFSFVAQRRRSPALTKR